MTPKAHHGEALYMVLQEQSASSPADGAIVSAASTSVKVELPDWLPVET